STDVNTTLKFQWESGRISKQPIFGASPHGRIPTTEKTRPTHC
ncbi:unnamed protein product, partial [Ectocarpus sp. 4 AP-2014]